MSTKSETEVIADIDNTLSQLEDQSARDRVLEWAWKKFSSRPLPMADKVVDREKPARKKKKGKSPAKTRQSPSIVKDLNLNPDGESSFRDFAQEKQPSTNQEKCAVAIYYLRHKRGINNISVNHVFTCFKFANWRVTDLYNTLVLTASRKKWIDTSEMENIFITTFGENFVEFDLPPKTKGK